MATDRKSPAIVFVPGLSQGATNTADRVAEVLAHAIDNQVQGRSYSTKSDTTITAPRGLKVSKTIVSSADEETYQIFELDYKPRFERRGALPGVQATAIGALEATKYMVLGAIKLVSATVRLRRSKSFAAKCQLGVGYALVRPLILAWIVAAYGLYVALGGPALPWLDVLTSDNALG